MDLLKRIADFLNLNFVFYAMIFFNVMWFCGKSPKYLIFYVFVLVFNVYICYVILRIKDRVTNDLVDACSDQRALSEEQRDRLRWRLGRSLQLGDLAEVAFGRLGRLVTESAMVLCIISMVTSQMCTVRLVFRIAAEVANTSGIKAPNLNSTDPHGHFYWSGDSDMYIYAGVILPIFLIFSLLPSYRSLAPVSLVGILAIAIASIHVISLLIGTGATYPQLGKMDQLDAVYVFESASPQIGLLILALSNSATDNRRGFIFTLLVTTIVTFCGISFVGLGLIFYHPPNTNAWQYPLLMKFYETLPQNVIMFMGYIAFVFVLNLPLFQLFDRWTHKMTRSQSLDDPIVAYTVDRRSVFEKLRRRLRYRDENILEPPRIQPEDVFHDLEVKTPRWLKYSLRLFIVSVEWGFSIWCWKQKNVILIFIGIEMVSTIFMGYVLPLIQYLRLLWHEIHAVIKLSICLAVVATIVMTIFAYYLEVGLYFQFTSNRTISCQSFI